VTIVNRRNAVIGWGVWKVSKRAMKRKAKAAKPSVEGGRPNKSLLAATAAGAAATVGALAFWRKRHGGDEDAADES
jgi:hypothetical protein